jgi:signal transduction histidine kinase
MKHVLDPFFTTKRNSGGTGLGLSISYNIIKNHGGNLLLTSIPGEGTRAEITLPVNRPPDKEDGN